MGHFHNRLSELKARRRTVQMSVPRPRDYNFKPPKADSASLKHIAGCLRRAGMERFADVIERAAAELAKHE